MMRSTRRAFLQASLAATAVAALGRAGNRQAPIKLGAQSYTWRKFTLEQTLARMQKLGLKYIEFATTHLPADSSPADYDAVLKLCKTYDVIPGAAGVLPFSSDMDANRRHFEFGKSLGVKVLSADPTPDAFDSLDKLCEEYGIAIAIHPHGPVGERLHRWYSAEVIMNAVKDHHPLIGSCLDTGHLIRSAQPPFNKTLDPAEQIRAMGKRNFGIHLKDHDNKAREDVIFGEAVLDVAGILAALDEVGFDGMISIEYEAKPDDPTDDVAACVEVVRKAGKRG